MKKVYIRLKQKVYHLYYKTFEAVHLKSRSPLFYMKINDKLYIFNEWLEIFLNLIAK